MTPPTKDRGRSGGDRATPKVLPNWPYRIAQCTQAAIERAALWGFVPTTLARRASRWIGGRNA